MTAAIHILRDDTARRAAISGHDRSVLVEAGAGSGKTAVMAGRIAAMLAQGTPPKSIAAVTFARVASDTLSGRFSTFEIVPTDRPVAVARSLTLTAIVDPFVR